MDTKYIFTRQNVKIIGTSKHCSGQHSDIYKTCCKSLNIFIKNIILLNHVLYKLMTEFIPNKKISKFNL